MASSGKFVGRAEELSLIRRAAEEVRQCRTPRFVLIEGVVGSGKTALVNESVKHLDWWRANVYLDASDQFTSGYAAQHVLRKPLRYQQPADERELAQWVQATADAISDPMIMVLEDLHWIDEESARIIYQTIREVEDVPMLNLVTMRPTERPEVRKFIRLTHTLGEAHHLTIRPFDSDQVRKIIENAAGLPVSDRVAAQVHRQTDGFPGLLSAMAEDLKNTELGRAPERLAPLPHGVRRDWEKDTTFHSVLDLIRTLEPPTVEVLGLLGCAERPLSPHEVALILERESIDLEALRSTGLIHESLDSGKLSIPFRIFAQAVSSGLGRTHRAQLNRRLAEYSQGSQAASHRINAALLDPPGSDIPATIELGLEAADRAVFSGDWQEAFELTRSVSGLDDSEEIMEAYAFVALRSGNGVDLVSAVEWAKSRRLDVLHRAILARDALEREDFEENFVFLRGAENLGETTLKSLVIFADTLLHTSRAALTRGIFGRLAPMVQQCFAALDDHLKRAAKADLSSKVGQEEQIIAEAMGVRALLRIWTNLAQLEYRTLESFSAEVQQGLDELEDVPGTELAQVMLRVARGVRKRLAGFYWSAYEDLSAAVRQWPGRDLKTLVLARIHLAYITFGAGDWEQSQTFANQAASEVLDVSEEYLVSLGHSAVHLVPAARASLDGKQWLSSKGKAGSEGESELAWASRCFVDVWSAVVNEDHETVVASILSMRTGGGVWAQAQTLSVLLGRGYFYSFRGRAIEPLAKTLKADPYSASVDYGTLHLQGLARAAAGAPAKAVELLLQANQVLEETPELHTSQVSHDGGALRIYRALLALDLAYCVEHHFSEVSEHREQAMDMVIWASAIFQKCGSASLFHRADKSYLSLVSLDPGKHNTGPARFDGDVLAGSTDLGPTARFALASLTRREREVAVQVAEGQSNKDIADQLVLSVRTVEYHVANLMAKLQLVSRRDVARLLAAEPAPDEKTSIR